MARRKKPAVSEVNESQAHKAENFRNLLLEHNNLTGQDKMIFENFVDGMSAVQLTNLSRQYHTILEIWYDSDGVSTAISEDIMRRIMFSARRTIGQIEQSILGAGAGTSLNQRISRLANKVNLKDTPEQDVLEMLRPTERTVAQKTKAAGVVAPKRKTYSRRKSKRVVAPASPRNVRTAKKRRKKVKKN